MSNEVQTPPRAQITYIQRLRCVGALAIVLLHVFSTPIENTPLEVIGYERLFWWVEAETVLTRWAVPVFLMITGALLLDPSKRIGWDKCFAYVRRMVAVLATFGLAFALIKEYMLAGALTVDTLVRAVLDVIGNTGWGHMWYIYVLIGIYLVLPILRAFVANSTERDLRIQLIVLYVCVLLLPTVSFVGGINIHFFIEFPYSVFYVLLGYYAHKYLQLDRVVVGAAVASVALCTASCAWWIFGPGQKGAWFYDPGLGLIVWIALLVFLLFKRYMNGPLSQKSPTAIVADLSFGIYVLHPIFLHTIYRGLGWMPTMLPPVVFELVVWAIAVAGSVALAWLLRLVPPIRRIL